MGNKLWVSIQFVSCDGYSDLKQNILLLGFYQNIQLSKGFSISGENIGLDGGDIREKESQRKSDSVLIELTVFSFVPCT